mmetsp:Transcript_42457/g.100259  ORF Transcript_42457/g.100259 Transcript_42457/m.100259 type:complete len:219 (-) Transcript_42457:484-1140(-)
MGIRRATGLRFRLLVADGAAVPLGRHPRGAGVVACEPGARYPLPNRRGAGRAAREQLPRRLLRRLDAQPHGHFVWRGGHPALGHHVRAVGPGSHALRRKPKRADHARGGLGCAQPTAGALAGGGRGRRPRSQALSPNPRVLPPSLRRLCLRRLFVRDPPQLVTGVSLDGSVHVRAAPSDARPGPQGRAEAACRHRESPAPQSPQVLRHARQAVDRGNG